MAIRRDLALLGMGIFISIIPQELALISEPTFFQRLSTYGGLTFMVNLALIIAIFLFSLGMILLALKAIKAIDDKVANENKEAERMRDNKLIESFKSALDTNNVKLAEAIKDALGK